MGGVNGGTAFGVPPFFLPDYGNGDRCAGGHGNCSRTAPTSGGSCRVAVGRPVARQATRPPRHPSLTGQSLTRAGARRVGATEPASRSIRQATERSERTANGIQQATENTERTENVRHGSGSMALAPSRFPSTPKPLFFVVVVLAPLCVLCVLCGLFKPFAVSAVACSHLPTISTSKGTMPARSQPRGGPLGVPQPRGAIRWMEQFSSSCRDGRSTVISWLCGRRQLTG
jgi:hypothetical protein